MTEMSKRPEEIKKGLECCAENTFCAGPECPYYESFECHTELAKDSFLLNRYFEEVSNFLREENINLGNKIRELENENDNLRLNFARESREFAEDQLKILREIKDKIIKKREDEV